MPSFNKVMLLGNLTRDPEIRYTPKGTAVAEVGLAINRNWTDDQGEKKTETTFVDVTLWARVAEIAQQYLKKGSPLFVEGRLQLETWQDKQTNQARSKLKVVGENIQLLGQRATGDQSEPTPSAALTEQRARHAQAGASSRPGSAKDPDLDPEPDDIPF
jgi:single-strand DNA-binding protein